MDQYIFFDKNLTKPDRIVLENLAADVRLFSKGDSSSNGSLSNGKTSNGKASNCNTSNGKANTRSTKHDESEEARNITTVTALDALNNPASAKFEPTIFNSIDYDQLRSAPPLLSRLILGPYTRLATRIVRHPTDVVMFTHLLLYFTTSVPSALVLFRHFTWIHGILHFVMQVLYVGTYTLMRHQHIHQNGILAKRFPWSVADALYPYILDPLLGHTYNSYYYHHVKHHHVEANGPSDLSSTIRYQRDSIPHFLHYVGRFFFFVWLDLPLYFLRKGKYANAAKCTFWELGNYGLIYALWSMESYRRPAIFVFVMPLVLMRAGMMVGNWGQHAFVDADEPDSDYRSSVTLIDVQSNRHSFNDGYHTSHHLNPLRHWREHPNSFMKNKQLYASQHALVFHNIDYLEITFRLMIKDYTHLAKCLVPIGEIQLAMNLDERAEMLKRHTRRFSEEEIKVKFKGA